MDTVIRQISEIEAATAAVMDDANARKKAFAEKMEAAAADFDRQLEEDTEHRISELRANMETEMNARLSRQQADAKHLLERMEQNYKDHHQEYAQQLFRSLTEE